MRPALAIVVVALVVATIVTVIVRSDDPPEAFVNATQEPQPTTVAPTATPSIVTIGRFTFPIAGACLPGSDLLMPGAPREYRKGIHEGIDFYGVDNCTEIGRGTEVVAAQAGTVIRASLDYHEMTPELLVGIEDEIARSGGANAEILDLFRGRQVWIDHGGGIVTRYAHLDGIAAGIAVETQVQAGQVIAFVGESGTPSSVTNPGSELHLHFEIRIGDSYLGLGLPPADVREEIERLFAP